MAQDDWSRVDYRRLIAWPQRIAREWPFLERALASAPSRAVLDLGSGTGEHSRHLAAHGYDVTGVDSSASMIAAAEDTPLPPNLRFVAADIADIGALSIGPAGGAICLGNTLPHLHDAAMRRLASGLKDTLLPGGVVVLQILNYDRIRVKGIRHLPLNFRRDEDGGETVFLRLMTVADDRTVVFTPTTLRLRPSSDPPVEIMHTRSVVLRAWSWRDLRGVFEAAGFARAEVFGGFDASRFVPDESADVVAVLYR